MGNVSPTVYYAGIILLALASLVAVYFKVLPNADAFIAIVSVLIGHGVTVVSARNGAKT